MSNKGLAFTLLYLSLAIGACFTASQPVGIAALLFYLYQGAMYE